MTIHQHPVPVPPAPAHAFDAARLNPPFGREKLNRTATFNFINFTSPQA